MGGGKVAERKIIALLKCGAKVSVVSPDITTTISNLAFQGIISIEKREYYPKDLEDSILVISATNNQELNQKIADECNDKNILVNVVDEPDKCSFILPAVLRRGPLTISVSTEGKSPLLARKIKEDLEGKFGDEYEEYIDLLGLAREYIKKNVHNPKKRYEKFKSLIDLDLLDLLQKGENKIAKERIDHVLGNCWSKS